VILLGICVLSATALDTNNPQNHGDRDLAPHHRSKRTINIFGMFNRMMRGMFGGGGKKGGKGGKGKGKGRGRGKGKGKGRPSAGYGVPQGRPISSGYGAPQRPQGGYGVPQGPALASGYGPASNNNNNNQVGYNAPQQQQQQPQTQPQGGHGGGSSFGGGGNNIRGNQGFSGGHGSGSGGIGGSIDSYGSPQAPPVGGGGGNTGNIDSYGSPQGAVVGNIRPAQSVSGYVASSGNGAKGQNGGDIVYGQAGVAMAPASLSNTVIKMLPAPNLATAAPAFGNGAGQVSQTSYGQNNQATSFNSGGSLGGSISPSNLGSASPAQDSYGIPQGTVLGSNGGSFSSSGTASGGNNVIQNNGGSVTFPASDSYGISQGNSIGGSAQGTIIAQGNSFSTGNGGASFTNSVSNGGASAPDSYGIPQGNVVGGSSLGTTNTQGNSLTSGTGNTFSSLGSTGSVGGSGESAPDSYGIPQGNAIGSSQGSFNGQGTSLSSGFSGTGNTFTPSGSTNNNFQSTQGNSVTSSGTGTGNTFSSTGSVSVSLSGNTGNSAVSAPDSYGIPQGNVISSAGADSTLVGTSVGGNGVSSTTNFVNSINDNDLDSTTPDFATTVNPFTGSTSGVNSASQSGSLPAVQAPDSYGLPQGEPVNSNNETPVTDILSDDLTFAGSPSINPRTNPLDNAVLINRPINNPASNFNTNNNVNTNTFNNNPSTLLSGTTQNGGGGGAVSFGNAQTSNANSNTNSNFQSIVTNSNAGSVTNSNAGSLTNSNSGSVTTSNNVINQPVGPSSGFNFNRPSSVSSSNNLINNNNNKNNINANTNNRKKSNNNNNRQVTTNRQSQSQSSSRDEAPIGELVSTEIEDSTTDISERPPIVIDLSNGNNEVDLTNGVKDTGSTIGDVDLTGKTTTSVPTLSATDDAEEVDNPFAGYDDIDENYDEYDYITDEEDILDPFAGIPGLDPDAPGTVVTQSGQTTEPTNFDELPSYTGNRNNNNNNNNANANSNNQQTSNLVQNQNQSPGLAIGIRTQNNALFDATLYDDEIAFLEEYESGDELSDQAEPPTANSADKVGLRTGKKTSVKATTKFEPAEYLEEYDDDLYEYDDQILGGGGLDDDRDTEFISVPLKIEEIGNLSNRPGDPTVILAGSPPEDEEDDLRITTFKPQLLSIRGRGNNRKPLVVRRTKKRVEDIPHAAFHAFLVEPPNGAPKTNNQKKRGVDWSEKLRERKRQKIWRQFRLN
ncbi:hypothetical protein TCAL_09338, partial [Tigriopus californicus]